LPAGKHTGILVYYQTIVKEKMKKMNFFFATEGTPHQITAVAYLGRGRQRPEMDQLIQGSHGTGISMREGLFK
jgi:hypothetical protein